MSAEDILGAVGQLNPHTLMRARRLAIAVALLHDGVSASEARNLIRLRCGCDRQEAHRLVNMALDMARPEATVP